MMEDHVISINQDRRQVDDILMNSELYHFGVKGMEWDWQKLQLLFLMDKNL